MKLKEFLKPDEKELITNSIKNIQSRTTGKIIVYFSKKSGKDPVFKAREVFETFNLKNSKDRNNVLFMISVFDRKIVIFVDDGIAQKVDINFLENIKNAIIEKFKNKEFGIGLIGGINLIGEKLIENFPDEKNQEKLGDVIFYEEN